MAVASGAAHFHAGHTGDGLVERLLDDAFRQRSRKRRPAAAGVELVPRAEQRFTGDHVNVDTVFELLVVGMRMGPVGGRPLGDVEGLGRECVAYLLVGGPHVPLLGDGEIGRMFFYEGAGVGEVHVAVAEGVAAQIVLVVGLGGSEVPQGPRLDARVAATGARKIHEHRGHGGPVGVVRPVDARAILGAAVVALTIQREGIHRAQVGRQQQRQRQHVGVVGHAHGLDRSRFARAHLLVSGVGHRAIRIADFGFKNAGNALQIRLGAPKAASG